MLNTSECATVTGRQRENQRSLTFQHSATVLVLAAFVSLLSRSPAPQDEPLHTRTDPPDPIPGRFPRPLTALAQNRHVCIETRVAVVTMEREQGLRRRRLSHGGEAGSGRRGRRGPHNQKALRGG